MSLTRGFLNDLRPLFRLLEEPLHTPTLTRFHRPSSWQPLAAQRQNPIEFSEEGNDVVVRAEVPGVQKEHLDVRLGNDGQSLTIEGRVVKAPKAQMETQASAPAKEATADTTASAQATAETVSQPEFRSSFSRTFWLPEPVNGTKAMAELADGILTLRIPKREQPRGQRIPIA
ncbi:heat shock protein HSP20 family protein [Ceratobasidium sp. AG-Ba]|nr:heat shock protein HSP20 family protein [Ceratobasidium sp. AG-Ba]QRW06721.1 heat shock protein HSP20 family protein [Ceratobasidium sp. AG-Ba]